MGKSSVFALASLATYVASISVSAGVVTIHSSTAETAVTLDTSRRARAAPNLAASSLVMFASLTLQDAGGRSLLRMM